MLKSEGHNTDAKGRGAKRNQATDERTTLATPWYRNSFQIIAMLSNFSTDYNIANISLVLPILSQIRGAENATGNSICASSLLAGMVVGQLLGGLLGDTALGRMGALRLVTFLQIFGSLVGAAIPFNDDSSFYARLGFCRFVLGVGAGGVYPLAAVLSAEQGSSNDKSKQAQRVVLTFSMQGLGFMSVPLLASVLLRAVDDLDYIWRLLLGIGSFPGIVLLYLHSRVQGDCRQTHEEPLLDSSRTRSSPVEFQLHQIDSLSERNRWIETIVKEPNVWRKLISTAGIWCLFDVLFYGNTLFQPIVVKAAFGDENHENPFHSLRSVAFHSLLLAIIALPGYGIAGFFMGRKTGCVTQTPKYIMLQGFVAMSLLYLIIGILWSFLCQRKVLLLIFYGLTFFFSNYGPNTTTFILPSLVFSQGARTTFNGVSAASGKLGAIVGASLFAPVASTWGNEYAMMICAIISLFCVALTVIFVPDELEPDMIEEGNTRSNSTRQQSLQLV